MAEEKQNVSVTCTATGQPHPSITWSKAFDSLPKDKAVVKNGGPYDPSRNKKRPWNLFVQSRKYSRMGYWHNSAHGVFSSAVQSPSSSRNNSFHWFSSSSAMYGRE